MRSVTGGNSRSSSALRSSLTKDDEYFGLSQCTALLKSQQLYRQPSNCNAAVLWERKSCGYRIVDLRQDKLAEALRFVPANFFYEEPLCRAVGLTDDYVSSKCYLKVLADKMNGMTSFCALAEGTGKIVGVAIACMHTSDQEFPYGITEPSGEAMLTMLTLKEYALPGSHICDALDIDNFCYIEMVCVDPSHQQRGIGTALVRSCVSRATQLQVPVVAGHFTTAAAQIIAERLGFQPLAEMPYEMFDELGYKDSLRRSFGFGNYSIALMASVVRQPEYEMSSPSSPSTTTTSKSPKSPKSPKSKRGKKKS